MAQNGGKTPTAEEFIELLTDESTDEQISLCKLHAGTHRASDDDLPQGVK